MKYVEMLASEIIAVADKNAFFVSKYGERFKRLRKKCRRMYKDGKLVKVSSDRKGFYYRTPEAVARGKAQQ